jgi:hypothetical protein
MGEGLHFYKIGGRYFITNAWFMDRMRMAGARAAMVSSPASRLRHNSLQYPADPSLGCRRDAEIRLVSGCPCSFPDTSMQALVLEKTRSLRLREIAIDEPLGPHDVPIRVHTVGVCGSEVHYYQHGAIGPFVVRE